MAKTKTFIVHKSHREKLSSFPASAFELCLRSKASFLYSGFASWWVIHIGSFFRKGWWFFLTTHFSYVWLPYFRWGFTKCWPKLGGIHDPWNLFLVGGFNPSETNLSKWESSPNRVENKKNETTTQLWFPSSEFMVSRGWFSGEPC